MQEAVKLIQESGIWVFLIGILTSIIIGAVKTPIRAKFIDSVVDETKKKKKENLFDTLVFLSTYVVAVLAAMVYYLISTKTFVFGEIINLSLPIWLSQSLAYGAWKKLGIKRFLSLLSKLIFRDLDGDGEISLSEAISQVVKGVKEGKVAVSDLINTVNKNLPEVVEEVSEAAEGSEEAELVEKVSEDGVEEIAENIKSEVISSAKEVANTVLGRTADGVEVIVSSNTPLKF